MPELKGSKTEANLLAAFSGESQARNKYTYYASKAKKDGYTQIAELFELTANNEKEHAKIWFKLINGGIKDTVENLKDAAEGERTTIDNTKEIYPGLFVSGMAANGVSGSFRMGPIFGGMLLSGKKAAALMAAAIEAQRS